MAINIKTSDTAFAIQNNQFCNNVDKVATLLSLDAEKVIAIKIANTFMQFIFGMQTETKAHAHSFTNYKRQLHFGPSTELMGEVPKPPVYPTVPVPISKGNVRSMLAGLAQDCVSSPKFTDAIGIALGIMDPVELGKDAVVVTPNLTIKHTTAGHPQLHATKGIYQGYEVWKDSNDGKGYLKLDTSLYPDFIDNSPLPTVGKAASWKYKIIYLLKGVQCGNWSAEVNIGVYGEI
jgi:hypothetical protein